MLSKAFSLLRPSSIPTPFHSSSPFSRPLGSVHSAKNKPRTPKTPRKYVPRSLYQDSYKAWEALGGKDSGESYKDDNSIINFRFMWSYSIFPSDDLKKKAQLVASLPSTGVFNFEVRKPGWFKVDDMNLKKAGISKSVVMFIHPVHQVAKCGIAEGTPAKRVYEAVQKNGKFEGAKSKAKVKGVVNVVLTMADVMVENFKA